MFFPCLFIYYLIQFIMNIGDGYVLGIIFNIYASIFKVRVLAPRYD